MPKVTVCFNPAHIEMFDGHEIVITKYTVGGPNRPVYHEFEARTAKEIRAKVDELGAKEHSVRASVRLEHGARKPPGFDALTRNLSYNLEIRER